MCLTEILKSLKCPALNSVPTTKVSKGMVHGVYKVVTQSSFGVTKRHKVSGGIGHFTMCSSDGY